MTTPERSVEEQISMDVLDTAREWMRRMDVKSGEDDREVRVVWIAEDTVRLCDPDDYGKSRGPEYAIRVKATQLPPPGPEQDGALQNELALLPPDDPDLIGPGLLKGLVEAALAWHKAQGPYGPGLAGIFDGPLARLTDAIERLQEILTPAVLPWPCPECLTDPKEDPRPWCDCRQSDPATDHKGACWRRAHRPVDCPAAPAGTWVPTYWTEVHKGDRIRVPAGNGYAEAVVESAMPLKWVGSGASQVKVRLVGRDQVYTMSGLVQVDVRTPIGADWPQWAGDAYRMLRQSFAQVTMIGVGDE